MEQDFIRPGAYNLLGSGSGSLGNGMNKSINPPGRGRALSSSACKSQGELGFFLGGSWVGIGALTGAIWDHLRGKGTLGVGESPWNIPRHGAGPAPPGWESGGADPGIPKEQGEPEAAVFADPWNGLDLFLIPPCITGFSQSFHTAQPGAQFPPALPNHHPPFAFSPISSISQAFPDKLCPG